MKRLLVALFLGVSVGPSILQATDKVLIMTYVHSRPDFIETHVRTFDAFLKENYKYVVFNDAPTEDMCNQVESMCRKLKVGCVRVPQHLHNGRQTPNYRHCDGIKYSMELLGFKHQGLVMLIDADMFLIKPFSLREYLGDHIFMGGHQERNSDVLKVVYTSPCLVAMDMAKLPDKQSINFECGWVEGLACDVGANTYHYFKKHPEVKVKWYHALSTHLVPRNEKQLREMEFDNATIDFIFILGKAYGMEFHGDNNFLHYYAGGSNWPGYAAEYHEAKTRLLNQYIDKLIHTYSARA